MAVGRAQWGSRLGFVLAASGSAVGLGNIWKFPYITGENGGGLFVLIYLVCIVVVGLPVMIAEVLLGRSTQRSPVPAFLALSGGKTIWALVGWMGVVTGFIILSYYSVIAGWAVDYVKLSISGTFNGATPDEINATFGALAGSVPRNVFWHALFMSATIGVVLGGIKRGIEAWSRVLMPVLFLLLLVMVVYAATLSGFGEAISFLFKPNADKLTGAGVLEALGHSFFTLSLGMGALITYGSYLRRKDDIVKASVTISILDTLVALMACVVMFPILFTSGQGPEAGPGLVFKSMPIAFSTMTGGTVLGLIFFVLLVFAALTSAISLLEVVVSTVIDQLGWGRIKATLSVGLAIFVFGIPSAAANSGTAMPFWEQWFGKNFLDSFDYLASNWFLPLGGLLIAIFVGWFVPKERTREQFTAGSSLAGLYTPWLLLIRFVVPVAIFLVLLFKIGVLSP
jgi:NSS family neurotransmitter:Na+ symporter